MKKSAATVKRNLHYVLSSHWDREWYKPFQYFRRRLVALFDSTIPALENGEIPGPFVCDGQAVMLEDYLQIRPEMEERVRALAKSGKLIIGPWFILPDLFLVSGESLARNLEYGMETARKFGAAPSLAGVCNDMFGHNAQMPRIFAMHGIKGALVWRGVDPATPAVFIWEGADGTRLPAYRFGRNGYCDFNCDVHRCGDHENPFGASRFADDLRACCAKELARPFSDPDAPGCLSDGGDHFLPNPRVYPIIKAAAADKSVAGQIIFSDYDALLDEIIALQKRRPDGWTILKGELREPARTPMIEDAHSVIAGVASSRIHLKKANAECEALLCQWAEPFAALAHLRAGAEYPAKMLELAWRYLLLNQPHDSICGCSIDQVHQDMIYRFSQSKQIAEIVVNEALTTLAMCGNGFQPLCDASNGWKPLLLTIFNPLSVPQTGVITFDIEIPAAWAQSGGKHGGCPSFRIFDPANGAEIPYYFVSVKHNISRTRMRPYMFPNVKTVHLVRVRAELELPALGWKTLRVAPPADGLPVRYPAARGLRNTQLSADNGIVDITVESGGGICIDEPSYSNLNTFESDADIGDGWTHGTPQNRRDIISDLSPCDIELVEDTPLATTFLVRKTMSIPERFDPATERRSERRVAQEIESRYTLKKGADYVEVETRVKNAAEDQRLRVFFPTNCNDAKTYLCDTQFGVLERPIALREDNHLYREQELVMKTQMSWTAVYKEWINDGEKLYRGLAIVCDGSILESGVLDRDDRPIVLTLLRATRKTVQTNGEPDGQLKDRELVFRYRIIPFYDEPDRVALFRHAQELSGGVRALTMDK
ncbi:MAG: glycoside hydrolase family 38, partial [Kiritimatiellaeota bacterium]|nr:glycoside hydrolase family 38 [Kiritimatiellota bacterium]